MSKKILVLFCFCISFSSYAQLEVDYNKKGMKYAKNKDYDNAIFYFKKSIEINSEFSDAWANIGLANLASEKYKAAIPYFDKALAIDSLSKKAAMSYMYRGQCYMEVKEYKFSIADLTRSLEIDPDNYSLYFEHGYVSAMLKDYAQVKKDFTVYLKHFPQDKMAEINLANAERLLGNIDFSLNEHNRLMKKYPGESILYNNRAEVYYELKQYDKALADIDEAISLRKNYAVGNFVKAKILSQVNAKDKACYYFNLSLKYGLEVDDDKDILYMQNLCK